MSTSPNPTRSSAEKLTTESQGTQSEDRSKRTTAFIVFSVFSVTLWLAALRTIAHVLDALAGDRLRVRTVVEDLDGNPTRVPALFQRGEDRPEVDLAKAGAAAIGVVGVEMTCA